MLHSTNYAIEIIMDKSDVILYILKYKYTHDSNFAVLNQVLSNKISYFCNLKNHKQCNIIV